MKNSYILPGSIIFLALSILFSSVFLGNVIKIQDPYLQVTEDKTISQGKLLITMEEASDFLGIPVEAIQEIINKEEEYMDEFHEFRGKMFPYVKVDRKIYFNKEELEEWVKEKAADRTDFDYYPRL